MLDVSES
jgi:hypothetical protein